MNRPVRAVLHTILVSAGLTIAACGREAFPVLPSPTVSTPTTLSGGNWSGNVVLNDGTTTSFNMTLIARGLGLTAGASTQAQAPGTVDVSGRFETEAGMEGTIQGSLQGTLQHGFFQGSLTSSSPLCDRDYAGPITESSVAWTPTGALPTGCPLTFSIQLPRQRGPDCQYLITLSGQSFSGKGGTGEVRVETGPACTWLAESPDPWIQFADSTPKVGSGTASFSIAPNVDAARDGRIRLANPNQTFTIKQGPGCTYSVAPLSVTVASGGGSGRVTVSAPTDCDWTAASGVEWIRVDPASGSGTATVTFTAQPNPGLARQGTFSVGGQTVTVSQGEGCVFTVTPLSVTVPLGGGSGSLSIAGASGCAWTAASDVNWITLSPASGNGSGSVSYTVLANSGPPRQGTLRVAGQLVNVVQGTCSAPVAVSVSVTNMGAGGGSGAVAVTAPEGCPWTASSNAPWITLSASGGTGNGSITLTVQPNQGAVRQGTITVGGQVFTITQDALVCIYELSPTLDTFTAAAGTRTATVRATAGCTWSVAATQPPGTPVWLTVSGASGVGPGTFNYSAAQNGGDDRSGTLTLTGGTTTLTSTITQAACFYQLTPTTDTFPASAETRTATVQAPAGCMWRVVAETQPPTIPPWLTVSGATGAGQGTFTYTAAANQSPAVRSGTLTLTGTTTTRTTTITQAGTTVP
jgi:hypothetical protein